MINATTESGAETSPNALDHLYTNLAPILSHTVQQFWWYVGPDPSGTLDIGS